MKHQRQIFLSVIILALVAMFAACNEAGPQTDGLGQETAAGSHGDGGQMDVIGCSEFETELWAGQTIDVGGVTVSVVNGILTVTAETEGGWVFEESHFFVGDDLGDVPVNGPGNPVFGSFPYSHDYSKPYPTTSSYSVDLNVLGIGPQLYIMFHASVIKVINGQAVQQETAFGGEEDFGSKRWAYYIDYTVEDCQPDGDEPDGDQPDGDDCDGDMPDGDYPDGDMPDGDYPDGDQPDGDMPDGDMPDGDQPDGDMPDGDQPDGDMPDGDMPDGDEPDGDMPDGDMPDGDMPDGDMPDGDMPDGDCPGYEVTLGPADTFNVFSCGDYTNGLDVLGKAAVANDASFQYFSVAINNPGGDVLIVGNDLSLADGTVYGNAVYGNIIALGSGVDFQAGGSPMLGMPIDFAAACAGLDSLSDDLAILKANGDTTVQMGSNGLILTGSDADLNIFDVAGADLNAASFVSIDVPAGSKVLINVSGAVLEISNFGFSLMGVANTDILWNFFEATDITIQNISFQGSALAVGAAVEFNNGNFEGTLVAGNLNGTGEFHNFLLNGPFWVEQCPQ